MNLKLKKTLIERAEARRRAEKDERDYLQGRLFNKSPVQLNMVKYTKQKGTK